MLSLTLNPKSRLLKCSDGIEMVDSRDLRHGLAADLDFPHLGAFGEIVDGGQVFLNGVMNIGQGLLFGRPLRPTTWQAGNMHGEPFFGQEFKS